MLFRKALGPYGGAANYTCNAPVEEAFARAVTRHVLTSEISEKACRINGQLCASGVSIFRPL